MNKILGDRIKEIRTSKNFTQEQVAETIGVSRQRYARMENGVNDITLDILSKLSAVFNVSVVDITKVLDVEPSVEYRVTDTDAAGDMITDMLDLFYANKHVYEKIQAGSDR